MAETNDRRSHPRVAYFTEAWLEGIDVSRGDVRITDISPSGAFVDARSVLPAGTVTHLAFTLGDRRVSLRALVRYSVPSIGMGLSFVDLSDEDRQALAEFVGVR